MLAFQINGIKTINAEYLVLDYNGTLATDGKLECGTSLYLQQLSEILEIHVLTADTFSNAEKGVKDFKCKLIIIQANNQAEQKMEYIKRLGAEKVIAIGNGRNDSLMLKEATLGIAVIGHEGGAKEAVMNADIITNKINDALELLLNPFRLKATLRN